MFHEQATSAVTSRTASFAAHFPTSVLLQEQRDESRPILRMYKEEKTSQVQVYFIYPLHQTQASLNVYNEIPYTSCFVKLIRTCLQAILMNQIETSLQFCGILSYIIIPFFSMKCHHFFLSF